jgi:nucleoside-diphosphate-sugar epimerase
MKNKMIRKAGKPRLLIVGCGDIGMRLLPMVRDRFRVFAVTSQESRRDELRAAGAVPVVADLDRPHTLARLGRLARYIVHLAPPQGDRLIDRRTRNLAAILPERATLVYVSTSGVYGDCGGALVDETRLVNPHHARAKRRVDAEDTLRAWAGRTHSRLSILRAPGIYAVDRLPIERLEKELPALRPEEDVYTNHIHADDLARLALQCLFRGGANRVYNASDDSALKMGEYFDAVAQVFDLPVPPRMSRAELTAAVSPMMLSFMSESRRLCNSRMKSELGIRLKYPKVSDCLRTLMKNPAAER